MPSATRSSSVGDVAEDSDVGRVAAINGDTLTVVWSGGNSEDVDSADVSRPAAVREVLRSLLRAWGVHEMRPSPRLLTRRPTTTPTDFLRGACSVRAAPNVYPPSPRRTAPFTAIPAEHCFIRREERREGLSMSIMIINLTPHTITVTGTTPPVADAPADWRLLPSGKIARATEVVSPAEPLAGIPTTRTRYTGVVDLPDPTPDTWYVVSSLAAQAAYESGRSYADLLVPGEQVRDDAGRISGCGSLLRWRPSRSEHVYHDAILWHAGDRTQNEYGYWCGGVTSGSDEIRRIAAVAEQLVAALCHSPGEPSREATRAIAEAVGILDIAQRREFDRRQDLWRSLTGRAAVDAKSGSKVSPA